MEVKKNVPEEVKNQMIDGKPRVVTEKIPEKFAKKIQEKLQKKQKLLNQFLQLSINILNAQEDQRNIAKTLKETKESITGNINIAFKKLRLGKKKYYHWRYDGRDSFIGVYNPPKPKSTGIKGAGIKQPPLPPKNPVRPSNR